ncbi:hypothetical protein BDZ45DRAFT_725257 [Acephala macrosclerotiorum]|nr:hypothetical protein BDZ45DRAFT_725257 [Acephala macrosclerotiorum]
MPPRKKTAKGSVRAASTPAADEDSMAIDTPEPSKPAEPAQPAEPAYDITKDPWTDEQETSLYKGIIKWKPAGMHKHFRMIALSEHLRNHGYDPTNDPHTRIPGIWSKLRALYKLPIIDDRENSFEYEEPDKFLDFEIPADMEDFEIRMWEQGRRKGSVSEVSSSPPTLSRSRSRSQSPNLREQRKRKRADTVTMKDKEREMGKGKETRASTVEDTDEAASSPPKATSTRAGRGANRSAARIKAESGSRHQSKDTAADTADEEETREGTEDHEDEEQDGEEEEEQEGGTPDPKPSRGRPKRGAMPARNTARRLILNRK